MRKYLSCAAAALLAISPAAAQQTPENAAKIAMVHQALANSLPGQRYVRIGAVDRFYKISFVARRTDCVIEYNIFSADTLQKTVETLDFGTISSMMFGDNFVSIIVGGDLTDARRFYVNNEGEAKNLLSAFLFMKNICKA